MRLLGNLFRQTSEPERQLEEEYVPFYEATQGLSHSQAIRMVRDLIRETKKQSQHEGTDVLNLGDDLLRRGRTDQTVGGMLAEKRKEGATDSDICWWWNMPDLERRMLVYHMNVPRLASLAHALEEGLDEDSAAARVRKIYPMFGDPNDTKVTDGDDRPLPYELQNRINQYVQRRASQDTISYKADVQSSTTFNALVRREIKCGNL
ncbi:MAG: hypothetical protein L6437_14880 [Kiritimatiellae bacterium]|nr:hypothetical protein [Planctomycetota bacterium]MCG2661516.1 hypothetical protein [Kiritimatiellia bacterium]